MTDNALHSHTGKFFEEFVQLFDDGTAKGLGVQIVENQEGRLLGVAGIKRIRMTKNFTVFRCFKEVTVRANKKNPVLVETTLQRIEGMK